MLYRELEKKLDETPIDHVAKELGLANKPKLEKTKTAGRGHKTSLWIAAESLENREEPHLPAESAESKMKTIIGISNFSLEKDHFSNFKEMENSLMSLQDIKNNFVQSKVVFKVGNDISKDSTFGLSLEQQTENFEYGNDKGVATTFKMKLHQRYLNGFDITSTTEQLRENSLKDPDERNRINYILYTPTLFLPNSLSFKNNEEFSIHYEKILGRYPIDNDSFYERATSHFTNLEYHNQCRNTLDRVKDGFTNYSIAFVACLKALNDLSPMTIPSTKEKINFIDQSTDYHCTSEGKSGKNFKFDFIFNGKEFDNLNCEYHLKPSTNNRASDNNFYHKRLYFGFIPLEGASWKIAVAAIGPHINKEDRDRYASPKKHKKK